MRGPDRRTAALGRRHRVAGARARLLALCVAGYASDPRRNLIMVVVAPERAPERSSAVRGKVLTRLLQKYTVRIRR